MISNNEREQAEIDEIWSLHISLQVFTEAIIRNTSLSLLVHVPNTMSRQVGFVQGFPLPISTKVSREYCDVYMLNIQSYTVLELKNAQCREKYQACDCTSSTSTTSTFDQ